MPAASSTLLDGRYRLRSPLGRGGMGEVWLADDELLRRRIAVKLLDRRLAGDASFVARFQREARSAAGLSHPNVVTVYDQGRVERADGDDLYIAMELLDGPTLADVIAREAPVAPGRAAQLLLPVLAALGHAHAAGLVHRDVKPANVLLTRAGQVKVADFGVARAADGAQLTETGSVLGSAPYLAPEAARGEPAGPAADLYGVGVVLYELLTGQVPFAGGPPASVALRHVTEAPRPPGELVPGLPAPLEALVLRALAKEPAGRPPSAEAFAAELAGPGGERPLARDGATLVLAPLRRRPRWVRAAAALGAAGALAVAGVALAGRSSSPPAARVTATAPSLRLAATHAPPVTAPERPAATATTPAPTTVATTAAPRPAPASTPVAATSPGRAAGHRPHRHHGHGRAHRRHHKK
jgi:serine/threonine-protein kinase